MSKSLVDSENERGKSENSASKAVRQDGEAKKGSNINPKKPVQIPIASSESLIISLQNVRVWTRSEEFQGLPRESGLSKASPSISVEVSLDGICTHLYKESVSNLFPDDTAEFKENVASPGRYIAQDDTEDLSGWTGFTDRCLKYELPRINQVAPLFDYEANELDLSDYGISNLQLGHLLEVLEELDPQPNIYRINLQNNPIHANGCMMISNFLSDNNSIEYLDLSHCTLSELGAEYLIEGIEETRSLKTLKLAFCGLGDSGGAYIAEAMMSNVTIEELDLRGNSLSFRTSAALGQMFKANSTLERLNLDWNNLYPNPESFRPFCKGLNRNRTLQSLSLAWNGFYGKAFMSNLSKGLARAPITVLNLEYNRIRNTELMPLIALMKRPKKLREVYLGGNYLSDEDYMVILKAYLASNNLNILSLGKNTFISKETAAVVALLQEANPKFKVIYEGILRNIPAEAVDMKSLVLRRCKFLAMKPKKKKLKRNMGHVMHWILDDERPLVDRAEVTELITRTFGAKLDEDLIKLLNDTFRYEPPEQPVDPDAPKKKRKGKKKSKLVEWHSMAELYFALFPTARGAPKPVPKEEGVIAPKATATKGKASAKDKKKGKKK